MKLLFFLIIKSDSSYGNKFKVGKLELKQKFSASKNCLWIDDWTLKYFCEDFVKRKLIPISTLVDLLISILKNEEDDAASKTIISVFFRSKIFAEEKNVFIESIRPVPALNDHWLAEFRRCVRGKC